MSHFNRKAGVPPTYVVLGGLLVPERTALEVVAEPEDETENLRVSTEISAGAGSSRSAVHSARPRRGNKRRVVFDPADVSRLADTASRLSRSSERRKLLEALLPALQVNPIGMRALCRVPRRLDQHCQLLRQEMPNFRLVIDRIEQWLQLQRAGDGVFQLPPLLLAGSPGVGKTYFATRLAKLLCVPLEVFSMEVATAFWVLTGSDTQWTGGGTGLIFNLLVHGTAANPILVVDELDKASSEARYAPDKALYSLLEPGTARHFRDEACRDLPLDTSGINWIFTANDVERIAAPLRSRLVQFDIPDLTFDQRKMVVRCVYRDMRKTESWGRRFDEAPTEKAVAVLARGEGSARNLRTTLMAAFAGAYVRGSRGIEVCDVVKAISRQPEVIDLASVEAMGHA